MLPRGTKIKLMQNLGGQTKSIMVFSGMANYTRVSSGARPLTKKPKDCFLQYHIQNELQTFDILA